MPRCGFDRRLELSEVHPLRVDGVAAITRWAVQIEGVTIDEVAKRLDNRSIGPRHTRCELLRRERKARVGQPHGRPGVMREGIIEQGRGQGAVWARTP